MSSSRRLEGEHIFFSLWCCFVVEGKKSWAVFFFCGVAEEVEREASFFFPVFGRRQTIWRKGVERKKKRSSLSLSLFFSLLSLHDQCRTVEARVDREGGRAKWREERKEVKSPLVSQVGERMRFALLLLFFG